MRSSKLTAGFDKITAFLKSSPHWPQTKLIQARAEGTLYRDPEAPDRVLAHFRSYPAETGFGMIAHARALLRTGKPERAAALVKAAWREHNFGSGAEKAIRKEFSKTLIGDDHRARLVRQLYARQTKNALRTASMISASHVKMVKAVSALLKRDRRAMRRYKAVPAKLRNQLVMQFALAHYYRRKGKTSKARDIVLKVPGKLGDLSYPEPWWQERWALIRTSLNRDTPKSWKSAYDMARAHGLKEGTYFVQGEFMSGWIALRFLKQPKRAIRHLKLILERDIKPLNLAQANYWLARAHRALKDEAKAKAYFEAAAKFPTTFYGQLGLDELGRGSIPIQLPNGPELSDATKAVFGQRDVIRAIRLLAQAGQKRLLPTFFSALSYRLESGEERVALASLALELGEVWLSVRVAKVSSRRGIRLGRFAYPKDVLPTAKSTQNSVERALIYAISRQESEFNPRAVSHAGALGLMQMMPTTARSVTKQLGVRYRKSSSLLDKPSYNVKLGTAFLGDLLGRFNGSYISAIAGYNAGPGRISQWNKRFGDPRKGDIEPVDWIESIPFNETRNYVKRVMESLQVYRTLFGVTPLVSLSHDLYRGGVQKPQTPAPGG